MAEGVDLSHHLSPYDDEDPIALLARALKNLGVRMLKLEQEQEALDKNMEHIAGALEAIIEAATLRGEDVTLAQAPVGSLRPKE